MSCENTNAIRQSKSDADNPVLAAEIESYWDGRSAAFSRKRMEELAGANGAAWTALIAKHLPEADGRSLRVLDIGTGAGFFAILLARAGHEVTAIDQSAEMLHHARQNALRFGCHAAFRKMDAQMLDFADETFDIVIARNVTWTLPDAMLAYEEWLRVLKTGGMLLNFDSDYGQETFTRTDDPQNVHASVAADQIDACNAIKDSLRISTHRRPAWDAELLQELGCTCTVDDDIRPLVQLDAAIAYDDVPVFGIYAKK